MRRIFGRLSALLLISFVAAARPAGAQLAIDGPAPDFSARTFDGRDVSLADYRGQVLVINFWATWCGPCKRELPLLDGFYSVASEKNYGLKILAITTEDSLPIEDLRPLAAKVHFDMARRFRGPYSALSGLPTNFVIDRGGVLRYAQAGAFDIDQLNAVLIPLLQERAPDAPSNAPTKASFGAR
jgi:thiol-disulfide isomerase/thioredoxin